MNRTGLIAAVLLGAAVGATPPAHAQASAPTIDGQQQPAGPPNALQGFWLNRDKPIDINAAKMEMDGEKRVATFSGDVHLVRGDTSLRSGLVVVFYGDRMLDQVPPKSGNPATASAQITLQQAKRIEAKGNVIVTRKDQVATGNLATFDMQANTVTMQGPVFISKGPNVLRCDALTVNINTGASQIPTALKLIIPHSLR
jgi:lipopolysaccharide export system protein LptA